MPPNNALKMSDEGESRCDGVPEDSWGGATDTKPGIGRHIGAKIRQRRTELGLTQEQLGHALGISYQQVQKYETAINRVTAARLYELACEFGIEVSYFFEGFETCSQSVTLPHGGHDRATIEFVRNFLDIKDEFLRNAVANLLKVLRQQGETQLDCAQASEISS